MPGLVGFRSNLMLACAGLALTSCMTGSSDTPPPPPPPPPGSITGTWSFALVVTVATGVCDGEEGDESTEPITITQTGTAVTARGFLGVANNQLTGTFNSQNVLQLSGSYSEDGGITTTAYTLTRDGPNQMTGTEAWNWVGAGGDCPGSASSVVATRN